MTIADGIEIPGTQSRTRPTGQATGGNDFRRRRTLHHCRRSRSPRARATDARAEPAGSHSRSRSGRRPPQKQAHGGQIRDSCRDSLADPADRNRMPGQSTTRHTAHRDSRQPQGRQIHHSRPEPPQRPPWAPQPQPTGSSHHRQPAPRQPTVARPHFFFIGTDTQGHALHCSHGQPPAVCKQRGGAGPALTFHNMHTWPPEAAGAAYGAFHACAHGTSAARYYLAI